MNFDSHLLEHKVKVRTHLLEWLADLQELRQFAINNSSSVSGIEAAIEATLQFLEEC